LPRTEPERGTDDQGRPGRGCGRGRFVLSLARAGLVVLLIEGNLVGRECKEPGRCETSGRRAQGGCLGDGGRGRTRPRGEMPGGGAGSLRSQGIRMGQPGGRTAHHPVQAGREPREVKHLSTARRREDSPSSGERTGRSPNLGGVRASRRCRSGGRTDCMEGATDPSPWLVTSAERHWNGRPERVRAP
jgi:hypothetical protein